MVARWLVIKDTALSTPGLASVTACNAASSFACNSAGVGPAIAFSFPTGLAGLFFFFFDFFVTFFILTSNACREFFLVRFLSSNNFFNSCHHLVGYTRATAVMYDCLRQYRQYA